MSLAAELTDRLLMLSAALLISSLWLSRLRPLAPRRWLDAAIMWLVRKLNRSRRSVATRVYRGIVLLVFTSGVALGLGVALSHLRGEHAWMELAEILLVAYLLPLRALRDEAAAVGRAVKREQIAAAKGLAQPLARREVAQLDAHGLLRVALEHLAENFCDKLLAPALFYALLGLPALLVLRLVNRLDSLIGHKSDEFKAFGWASAKLDDALMWLPARLCPIFMALAALFVPKAHPFATLQMAMQHAGHADSPNAGWPIAAMAGALKAALGGPRRHQGTIVADEWMGRGSARLSYPDFRRGLMLYNLSALWVLLACVGALSAL